MEDMDMEALASQTDKARRSDFIAENASFIQRCAYRAAGRYISRTDEEWSVAQVAFDEAVRSYSRDKGSFDQYAYKVIRRSLEGGGEAVKGKPVSPGPEKPRAVPIPPKPRTVSRPPAQSRPAVSFQAELARKASNPPRPRRQRGAAEEIEALQAILQPYGFDCFSLAGCSPRSEKARRGCAQAINTLLAVPGMMYKLRRVHSLPVQELSSESAVPRKVLERHKRYIIAAAEILDGDYPNLADYLGYVRKAVRSS